MKNVHELYMRRALDLARMAEGFTPPNPMVGAVLVYEERIIGEGYHHRAGEPHAEVMAFQSVRPEDESLLPRSSLYVTLEPCCHHGKTPPCADLILEKKVPAVFVAMRDPFPKVDGGGIAKLRTAGVAVEVGLLQEEAEALNSHFLLAVRKERPYITLKWAQSQDGFIDDPENPDPILFSDPIRSREVHRLRHIHDAILIGGDTYRRDHPRLTNRYWWGRQPLRLVLTHATVSADFRAVSFPDTPYALAAFLHDLYLQGIHSLLVEGGAKILQLFLKAGYADRIEREIASFSLGKGVSAPNEKSFSSLGLRQISLE